MDPLSITASVVGISEACLSVTKALGDFRDKYQKANLTITAICSETSVVSASLSQIQSLLYRDGDALILKLEQRPDLASTFDIALTGCMVLYSSLEDEIADLRVAIRQDDGLGWKDKFKTAWKEDDMTHLLQQIRGQVIALNVLLQGLQIEAVSDIQKLLLRHEEVLRKIKKDTTALRAKYTSSDVPSSIFESKRTAESIFGDTASVIEDTAFSFDDLVIDSQAYRHVMKLAQSVVSDKSHQIDSSTTDSRQVDTSDKSVDTVSIENLSSDTPSSVQWKGRQTFADTDIWATSFDVDWVTAFELRREELEGVFKAKIEFQNIWWELFTRSRHYVRDLKIAFALYRDQILVAWPKPVPDPVGFVQRVFNGLEQILAAEEEFVYRPLLSLWTEQGAWASFDAKPYLALLDSASTVYSDYCGRYPEAVEEIQRCSNEHAQFREFLKNTGRHPLGRRLPWVHYLRLPITQLEVMTQLLGSLLRQARRRVLEGVSTADLIQLIEKLTELIRQCDTAVGSSANRVWLQHLATALPSWSKVLALDSKQRRLITHNRRACKEISKTGSTSRWLYYDVIVLDNDILFTKPEPSKSRFRISGSPSWDPDGDSTTSLNVKFSMNSIMAVREGDPRPVHLSKDSPTSIRTFSTDRGEVSGGTTLFPVRLVLVRSDNATPITLILGAKSNEDQKRWCEILHDWFTVKKFLVFSSATA